MNKIRQKYNEVIIIIITTIRIKIRIRIRITNYLKGKIDKQIGGKK